MAHDQLVEYLVENLQLLDSAFAVEILDAIDASGTHVVILVEELEALRIEAGFGADDG